MDDGIRAAIEQAVSYVDVTTTLGVVMLVIGATWLAGKFYFYPREKGDSLPLVAVLFGIAGAWLSHSAGYLEGNWARVMLEGLKFGAVAVFFNVFWRKKGRKAVEKTADGAVSIARRIKNPSGGPGLPAVALLLAGGLLALSACASAFHRTEATYAALRETYELALEGAKAARVAGYVKDRDWEKIREIHERARATDRAARDLLLAWEKTEDAVRREAILAEVETLLKTYAFLAADLRVLVAAYKEEIDRAHGDPEPL